jgi:hypothetical protein
MSASPERFPQGSTPASREAAGKGDPGGPPDTSAPSDVAYVLDAMKLSLDQELQVAQRLRDRARQVFVLAVAFFTIVQTVAFSSFAQKAITEHKVALIVVLALGIGAIVLLARTAFAVSRADAPSRAGDLPVVDLEKLLNAAYDRDPAVPGGLGEIYLGMIEERREANDRRVLDVGNVQVWGLASISMTTIELIVALALRIP